MNILERLLEPADFEKERKENKEIEAVFWG